MDLFIDKLAQKFTGNDQSRSVQPRNNQSGESKEIRELKEKVENYEKLLQEMKLVNLKNMESAEKLRDMVEAATEAAQTANSAPAGLSEEEKNAAQAAAEADREMIRELFDKQSDTIHKENIKVYRNVQAAVGEGLSEQTKSILEAQQGGFKKSGTGFLKVMSVLIFIAVLADIALKVLPMFGLL